MKTILIAEDEHSNFLYLKVLLRGKYNLIHAEDGNTAVEMAKEHKPDIILMDVKMSGKDGIEALDEIRKTMPNIPVIMQSAYAFDSDISKAMHHGANGYLTKPILKEQLEEALAKYV